MLTFLGLFSDQLIKGWKRDVELQEKFTTDDLIMINKLDDLLKRTNEREGMVGGVKNRLSSGMKIMDDFLGEIKNAKYDGKPKTAENRIEEETNENNETNPQES